ncbi:MAG: hypothetical protein ACLS90_04885 [Clostridia bacterium]
MLHVVKDDFDENPEDILNSINNMLKRKKEEQKEQEQEQNKE